MTTNDNTPRPAPYVSRFVEVAGLRLHYLEYGADHGNEGKPVMLCLHGGAAHAHWFDFVAGAFTVDHRVLALDQRGHGDSEWANPPEYTYSRWAADLAEAVDRLDLRDFVLVGHSMGGAVSLEYAATFPGRVARIVIIDSMLRLTEDSIASMKEVGSRQGRAYASREEFVERYRLRPKGTHAAPDVLRHIAENSARQHADGWRHKFDRNVYARREAVDCAPHWGRIRIPALLIKGEHSPRISAAVCAEIRSRCPQVELAEVTGCDHHVTLDNPAGFVAAVRPFLARSA